MDQSLESQLRLLAHFSRLKLDEISDVNRFLSTCENHIEIDIKMDGLSVVGFFIRPEDNKSISSMISLIEQYYYTIIARCEKQLADIKRKRLNGTEQDKVNGEGVND